MHPGHVFPLVAQDGGVLMRAGHTEACCDLARLAGLTPAAVLCEIMRDDGTMARLPDLVRFARAHQLKIGTIADLIQYRSRHESMVERVHERANERPGQIPTAAYRDPALGASCAGPWNDHAGNGTLVRVHEPLSVLDLLDSYVTHSWASARR